MRRSWWGSDDGGDGAALPAARDRAANVGSDATAVELNGNDEGSGHGIIGP